MRHIIFGESHGPAIGVTLEGAPSGVALDWDFIRAEMARRAPGRSAMSTARKEADEVQILSGVFEGKTTGTPLCAVIPNTDTRSGDYAQLKVLPRPGHADYSGGVRYGGHNDYRGGGHFSGRVTAALTAAGGILLPALEAIGVTVGTHILECAGVRDRAFSAPEQELPLLRERAFSVLDPARGEEMAARILQAAADGDSVGGVTQTAVCGMPAGVGEPWFDSVESLLSHALFGVGGVKGVEFGTGFGMACLRGSQTADTFRLRDGAVVTETNHNGGVNGGITNGMPIVFQCAVKPTPSIAQPQPTVDFLRREETTLAVRGRHDPAILRRVCPVIDSVTAIVLCDLLAQRFGTDVLTRGISACSTD